MNRPMERTILIFVLVAVSMPAFAQKKRARQIPDAIPKTQQSVRKVKEKDGPNIRNEAFFRKRTQARVESKWKELFKQLRVIIKQTPDSDPAKPELYYRLSELFRERAAAISLKAFDKEFKCQKRAGTDEAEYQRCEEVRKQEVTASTEFRDKAIKVYKHIVRNYPQYPRLDNVLYSLAFNYQQKGKPEAAKKIYKTLIQKFPRSSRVPDTLVNLGEIFFAEGKAPQAVKLYERVVTNHADSSVYGYARYKLGWCNYNLGNYRDALGDFLAVIKYSRKQRGGKRQRLTLLKEATRDLVRTYVHIDAATPAKAIKFFRKIDPDNYMDLVEKLARRYSDTGQFSRSNEMYRNLIKLNKRSYVVVSYQRIIADNTQRMGFQKEAVQETKRLVSLWRKVQNAPDAKPERVAKDREGIEQQLRTMANLYHRQSATTKSNEDYAVADALYGSYMETFPKGRHAYEMGFFYAELLMTLKKWEEAAGYYERILKEKPKGEYSADAASSLVVAYKTLLQVKEPKSGAKRTPVEQQQDTDEQTLPEPKDISGNHARYLTALQNYLEYVRGEDMETDIAYDIAKTYYDFNQFDKAKPRFKSIAENKPQNPLGVFSANLLLDILALQSKYTELNQQAEILLGLYPEEKHPKLYDRAIRIKQKANFNTCKEISDRGEQADAAKCYLRFSRDFPNSEFLAEAYLNAAVEYQKQRLIMKSSRALLKVVNDTDDPVLQEKALFTIGQNFEKLAIFSKASSIYEQYANEFPDAKRAPTAMRAAAIFRMGLGKFDKAIANFKVYMKLVGKEDETRASEIYFKMGHIYRKQGQWRKMVKHYKSFLKKYGDTATIDLKLQAYTLIGNAHWEQAQPYINRRRKKWKNFDFVNKKAQRAYNSTYQMYLGLPRIKAGKDGPPQLKTPLTKAGLSAVAEARFKMGETAYYRVKYRSKLKAKYYKNVKKFTDEMKKRIKARGREIMDVRKIYKDVIDMNSPNWAIAAIARQGEMTEEFSNAIYGYPAPPKFTEDQKEAFKTVLVDLAEKYRQRAIRSYTTCLKLAQTLEWFNPWSDNAEKRLADLDPEKYSYNAEMRANPTQFSSMFLPPPLITDIEEASE